MTTAQRIRKEYGSIKAALKHCAEIGLKLYGTAQQLECSTTFVRGWEKRTGVNIPRGVRGGQKGHPGNPNGNIREYNAKRKAERLAGMRGVKELNA